MRFWKVLCLAVVCAAMIVVSAIQEIQFHSTVMFHDDHMLLMIFSRDLKTQLFVELDRSAKVHDSDSDVIQSFHLHAFFSQRCRLARHVTVASPTSRGMLLGH